ncbi:MAG: hypothetical protein HYX92_07380 [Chloroflexi bacterium]|nr:hypothetical protein [Chloroflexota bacterium]
MHSRTWLVATGCLTALGLLAASCAPAAPPAPAPQATAAPSKLETPAAKPPAAPSPSPKAAGPRSGGVLPRANADDPPHLDIHQVSSISANLSLTNVYNALLRLDPANVDKAIPDLAEKWTLDPDGKTYTFRLREGVKWHDGKPFTSADVKFSLDRMAFWKEHKIVSPRGGALLSAVEKVEVLDPSAVKVSLKYPSGSFLGNLSAGWVLMLPRHIEEARGDLKKDAVGTGPFKWKAWNLGSSIELTKNPDYFLKGLPYLDGITIYAIRDDATRFAAFRTGRVRMTTMTSQALTHVQADKVRQEMADRAVVITHPTALRFLLFMPSKRKPWDDVRVRQAVHLAFDRKAALAVNYGMGVGGAALHPNGAWGIPEDDIAKRPGFRQPKDADVATARRLLAEAGYQNGFKTRFLVLSLGTVQRQGEVVRDQLAQIGIDAALELQPGATFYDRMDRHDFDLGLFSPAEAVDDPDSILTGYYVTGAPRNFGEFSDREIDELSRKQAAMMDVTERRKVVLQAQERILELGMYVVLFWDSYNVAFWKEVRGFKPGFGGFNLNNLDHVWLDK